MGACFVLHSTNAFDILFGWVAAKQFLDQWTIKGDVVFGATTEGTGYAVFTSAERVKPTTTTTFANKTQTGFELVVEDPDGGFTDGESFIAYYLVVGTKLA